MKLFLALILLGGLAAAAVLVPVSGETAWQHAERKGWPLAAARGFARAANSGARWVADALQGTKAAPAPAQPTRGPRRRLARVPAPGGAAASPGLAHAPNPGVPSSIARAAPAPPPAGAPLAGTAPHSAPAAPAAGTRDRIVAATPAERLDGHDRAALDKLLSARGGR